MCGGIIEVGAIAALVILASGFISVNAIATKNISTNVNIVQNILKNKFVL